MTPGKIYMDNCVTTPLAPEALEAMRPYFTEEFWFPGAFISTGEATSATLAGWHDAIAKTLNATGPELHFTSGGTLANNLAIKGLAWAHSSAGKHAIVSVVDYPDLLTNAAWLEIVLAAERHPQGWLEQ
ncbi:MAG TPA: aminotransferase class V-fold PLP-dependent enzyme, partial [Candidatus Syntrophosphaera sp.]|nr:aminotransferase class V-fold PLP-dependent enzyme [Candidatus Syntrophosphaera sp.]